MKYLNNIDLCKNELQNALLHKLASAPANPVKGQCYFNTTDNKAYIYDGTSWIDMTSQGNYTFTNGLSESNRTVEIGLNSTQGNVTLTTNGGLAASVAEASTSAKGIIEIATDSEATTGTSETLAVNPKQLAVKLDKKPDGTNDLISNNKISTTYIPDVILGQLLYGGTVTAAGVATLSTNAKTKLGTSSTSITLTNDSTAVTGYEANEGIYYIASSDATSGSDFASLGLLTGDWLISTGAAWKKIDNTDAVTSVNGQLGAVSLGASDVSALPDSTKYGAGLSVSGTTVQLLDQDGNNLGSPITTQDTTYSAATTSSAGLMPALESASVSTQSQSTKFLREDGTWAAPSYTVDTNTWRPVKVDGVEKLDGSTSGNSLDLVAGTNITLSESNGAVTINASATTKKYTENNSVLTPSSGLCTWTVTHSLGTTDVIVMVNEVSTGAVVIPDITITSSSVVTIKIVSASNIAADTYKVTVMG